MIKYYCWLALPVLLLVLAGCQGRDSPIENTNTLESTRIEIWASKRCPEPHQPVKLRATVTNGSKQPLTVQLKEHSVIDIEVDILDIGTGDTIFWSDGKSLTPDLTHLELKPGESKSIEMDWVAQTRNGSVPPTALAAAIFRLGDSVYGMGSAGITLGVGRCGDY